MVPSAQADTEIFSALNFDVELNAQLIFICPTEKYKKKDVKHIYIHI